jgi:hypothetical protein
MILYERWKVCNERERRWKRYRSDSMETGSFVPTLDMVGFLTHASPTSPLALPLLGCMLSFKIITRLQQHAKPNTPEKT